MDVEGGHYLPTGLIGRFFFLSIISLYDNVYDDIRVRKNEFER